MCEVDMIHRNPSVFRQLMYLEKEESFLGSLLGLKGHQRTEGSGLFLLNDS